MIKNCNRILLEHPIFQWRTSWWVWQTGSGLEILLEAWSRVYQLKQKYTTYNQFELSIFHSIIEAKFSYLHFYISNRELWNHTYDHCRQSMFSCWCLFCFPPLGFLVGVWSLVLECHPPLVLKVIQPSRFDIYWCIDLNKNDTDNFLWYWLFCS